MFGIKTAISLFKVRYKWRKLNPHNSTRIGKYPVGLNNLSVGPYSYGCINISTSSTDPILEIGAFCSIADDAIFITENGHNLNNFSSFPFKVKVIKSCKREAVTKGGIILEDDVWIGYGAIVLDGVKIGRGGGCRRGGGRRERCGALYDCRRRACQAHQEEIQPRRHRPTARSGLHERGQKLRGIAPRAAIPSFGRKRSQGATR